MSFQNCKFHQYVICLFWNKLKRRIHGHLRTYSAYKEVCLPSFLLKILQFARRHLNRQRLSAIFSAALALGDYIGTRAIRGNNSGCCKRPTRYGLVSRLRDLSKIITNKSTNIANAWLLNSAICCLPLSKNRNERSENTRHCILITKTNISPYFLCTCACLFHRDACPTFLRDEELRFGGQNL